MTTHPIRFSLPVILILCLLASAAQRNDLPPLVWTCPMHPEIVEDHDGKCPICGMKLERTRLDYAWSCPVHSVIDQDHPGTCPICRRELVQITVGLSFTCPDNPKINQVNPGKCRDGSAMLPVHTPRAHGNHNPQHGGMFFMASDNWHHIEGTYPENGLFRLYLYDDFSWPLPVDQTRLASGTIVSNASNIALKPAADGKSLEGRIANAGMPAKFAVNVKFKRDDPTYHFDFTFPSLTSDAPADLPVVGLGTLEPVVIPEKTAELVALLTSSNRKIQELIEQGSYGEIYVPAFQAKDLALALELRGKELPLAQRSNVTLATEKIVRLAWQLDAYGDLGDGNKIKDSYATFASAVHELETLFLPRRP